MQKPPEGGFAPDHLSGRGDILQYTLKFAKSKHLFSLCRPRSSHRDTIQRIPQFSPAAEIPPRARPYPSFRIFGTATAAQHLSSA